MCLLYQSPTMSESVSTMSESEYVCTVCMYDGVAAIYVLSVDL